MPDMFEPLRITIESGSPRERSLRTQARGVEERMAEPGGLEPGLRAREHLREGVVGPGPGEGGEPGEGLDLTHRVEPPGHLGAVEGTPALEGEGTVEVPQRGRRHEEGEVGVVEVVDGEGDGAKAANRPGGALRPGPGPQELLPQAHQERRPEVGVLDGLHGLGQGREDRLDAREGPDDRLGPAAGPDVEREVDQEGDGEGHRSGAGLEEPPPDRDRGDQRHPERDEPEEGGPGQDGLAQGPPRDGVGVDGRRLAGGPDPQALAQVDPVRQIAAGLLPLADRVGLAGIEEPGGERRLAQAGPGRAEELEDGPVPDQVEVAGVGMSLRPVALPGGARPGPAGAAEGEGALMEGHRAASSVAPLEEPGVPEDEREEEDPRQPGEPEPAGPRR